MVLIHKLKQMEALDIERLRDSWNEESRLDDPILSQVPPLISCLTLAFTFFCHQPRKSRKDDSPMTTKKRMSSPPRRPITRSQTTQQVLKRKIDHTSSETEYSSSSMPTGGVDVVAPAPSQPAVVPQMESKPDIHILPSHPPGQYTFGLGSSNQLFDRRGPRSRAVLPVPVPNLTKKSRGRRVPTIPTIDKESVQKPGRLYVCKVLECGKCFNRGEHLKRHIRSIHTHEKRTFVLTSFLGL